MTIKESKIIFKTLLISFIILIVGTIIYTYQEDGWKVLAGIGLFYAICWVFLRAIETLDG